ncbi:uncharacterized protein LOC131698816 [Acipenser ruthenus]|uniref:uncharacterized protein LOC131698816 n=1 Tax=Acipenser ruthenus TaxID=7906 RepID=UPI0027425EE3|nr:uncharacterized protein LOC131698816 [Acipenser ruthenus]
MDRVMSQEKHPKLKLKRKKSVVHGESADLFKNSKEGSKTDLYETTRKVTFLEEKTESTFSCDAGAWWDKTDLTENLWASTLKSVYPDLKQSTWEPVPDLPAFAPKAWLKQEYPKLDDCIGGCKAWTPFPSVCEPAIYPDLGTELKTAIKGEVPVELAKHGLSEPNQPEDSSTSKGEATGETARLRSNETYRTDHGNETEYHHHHHQRKPSRSSGPTGGRSESTSTDRTPSSRVAGPQRPAENLAAGFRSSEEAQSVKKSEDAIKKQLPVLEVGDVDSCITIEDSSSDESPMRADHSVETPRKHGNAANHERVDGKSDGRLSIESCPMCLQQFPAGFTQLETDCHLAKCLSEMNEDIEW